MLRLAADENFNFDIVRGLRRANSRIDIVTVQAAGLCGAPDPQVLEWAAETGRLLLSHDVATMTRYAYERVSRSLRLPGLVEVSPELQVGVAINDILLLAECSLEKEWEAQVLYLPLQ